MFVSMTRRRMSREQLLQPPLAGDRTKRGIHLRFRHDKRESTVKRLGFGRRGQNLSGFVELRLIDANVFVSNRSGARHENLHT